MKRNAPRRRRHTIDLRATLAGRSIEYANDLDRRYFREHPLESRYVRPAIEHEFAPYVFPTWRELSVLVVLVAPGLRMRTPLAPIRSAS